MQVYKAINAIQDALSKVGIAKDSRNQIQNFNFRGIDAVYNTLSPLLAQHGLCILPRMISRTCDERVSGNNKAVFYVTVEAEFDLVCAEDGSKHTIKTFGEAMDSGDKATNKAMSAAYKYACFQAFAIPTEGDNDADAHTHEVHAKAQQAKPKNKTTETKGEPSQEQIADWIGFMEKAPNLPDLQSIFSDAYRLTSDEATKLALKTIYDGCKVKFTEKA